MEIQPTHPVNAPVVNTPPLQGNGANPIMQVPEGQPCGLQIAPALAQPSLANLNTLLRQVSDDETELLELLRRTEPSAIAAWKDPNGNPFWEVLFVCGRPQALDYCVQELALTPSQEVYLDFLSYYTKSYAILAAHNFDDCLVPKNIGSKVVVEAMIQRIFLGLISLYNHTEDALRELIEKAVSILNGSEKDKTSSFLNYSLTSLYEQKRQQHTKSSRCIPAFVDPESRL